MPLAAFLARIALIVGALALAVAGCGFPHYEFPPNERPDASFDGGKPSPDAAPDRGPITRMCASADDCVGSSNGPLCDLDAGRCVQCIPGIADCTWGYYCDNQRKCSLGCGTNDDCSQPPDAAPATSPGSTADPDAGAPQRLTCDTSNNKCLGCAADSDCPPSSLCETQSKLCLPGRCTTEHRCADGWLCCAGQCVAPDACSCPPGFWDCNMKPADGCETPANTVDNCGGCGQKCSYPQRGASCDMTADDAGASRWACAPGPCIAPYEDCNQWSVDGCEANTSADPLNCGVCHHVCQNPHGTNGCMAGVCKPNCDAGWTSCDAAVGCTVDTNTDPLNCGACGHVCKGGGCNMGKCECWDVEPDWSPADGGSLSCSGAAICGPYSGTADQACKCFCVNQKVTCRINIQDGPPC